LILFPLRAFVLIPQCIHQPACIHLSTPHSQEASPFAVNSLPAHSLLPNPSTPVYSERAMLPMLQSFLLSPRFSEPIRMGLLGAVLLLIGLGGNDRAGMVRVVDAQGLFPLFFQQPQHMGGAALPPKVPKGRPPNEKLKACCAKLDQADAECKQRFCDFRSVEGTGRGGGEAK
jgi:hypothetical protein